MAKVTGPILSLGAKGQIAKGMVFATWRGVKYARQYVVPSNPNSTKQQAVRSLFAGLNSIYKYTPEDVRQAWTAAASGRKLFDRNLFISQNLTELKGGSDRSDIVMSPGALGGPPLEGMTATTGSSSGEIDVTAEKPDVTDDWHLTKVIFAAVPNASPGSILSEVLSTLGTTDFPASETIDGLDTGQEYVISAFPIWTRPDGRTAFGHSINATATAD